jgi:exopolysaccharide production protein ExoZ
VKLRSIQVLRALAVSTVVAGHDGYIAIGSAGVDLFFVISGFIIATIAPGRSPAAFLRQRLFRIYPVWFIYLVPWLLIAIINGQTTPARTAASLTLWPVFDVFTRPYLKVGWTLSFELLFYLAATVALATKRPSLVLAALGAAFIGYRIYPSALLGFLGNPIILEFLAGVVIAKLPRPEVGGAALPLGLILFFVPDGTVYAHPSTAIDASVSLARVIVWGIPASLTVYGALCLEKRFASKLWDGPVAIGDASYTIYLSHLLLMLVIPLPWWAASAVLIGTGWLLYKLIEEPIIRRAHRLRREQRQAMNDPADGSDCAAIAGL